MRLTNLPFLGLIDGIIDDIQNAILTAIGTLLYGLTVAILNIFKIICSLFNVFAGIDNVTYRGKYTKLINVFFENSYVDYVYKGMMLLGIVLCIGFTIAAVIRRMFDINDKHDVPLGGIILNAGKAILIMLLMTFIVSATLSITNTLIQRVSLLFDNAMNDSGNGSITFTDQDFATMGRIYNTIGNYAVNPSYESRYNINSCFNDIRDELSSLNQKGVFRLQYVTRDSQGRVIDTWQSVLQKIVVAAPLDENLSVDVYNAAASNAIMYAMDVLKNNPSFAPLQEYSIMNDSTAADTVSLDRVMFLMGTSDSALNDEYNEYPSMNDAVRGPFFLGEKSVYDFEEVSEVFDIKVGGVSYFTIIVATLAAIWQIGIIILNCAQRIFSMLVLYLVSPPIVAVMPYDDGAKFKQWVSAFVVQACGVLGQVIAMRVLILFIPIAMSSDLDLNLGGVFNFVGKAILIICVLFACRKITEVINGILADNGGGASAQNEGILGRSFADFAFGKAAEKIMGGKEGGGGSSDKDKNEKEKDGDAPDKANVLTVGGEGGEGGEGGKSSGGNPPPKASTTTQSTPSKTTGQTTGSNAGTSTGGSGNTNDNKTSTPPPTKAKVSNNSSAPTKQYSKEQLEKLFGKEKKAPTQNEPNKGNDTLPEKISVTTSVNTSEEQIEEPNDPLNTGFIADEQDNPGNPPDSANIVEDDDDSLL